MISGIGAMAFQPQAPGMPYQKRSADASSQNLAYWG